MDCDARVIVVWVCLVVSGHAFDELTIIPNTNQTEIDSGEDIILVCSYTKPIYWKFPDTVENNNTKTWKEGRYYKNQLTVHVAKYSQTGYYECVHDNGENAEADVSDRIYIYVNDPKKLFVSDEEFEWLTVTQHSDAVIPCRVTSPKVHVRLTKDSEEVMLQHVSYDPAVGFTFTASKLDDTGQYSCIAQLGNELLEEHMYSLHVLRYTNSVVKPEINDGTKMHVEVDDTINMFCHVQVAIGVKFTLSWDYPNKRNTTIHHVIEREDPTIIKEMQETTRFLTIHNATHADQGTYSCEIRDHNLLTNSASTYLRVYEKNTTYLNLSLQGHAHIIEQHAGETVQWVVYITAHPEPEVQWIGPLGEVIVNSLTHTVMSEPPMTTTLQISQVKISDAGNYSLVASNNAGIKRINVSLIVLDRPMVTVMRQETYTYNHMYRIDCSVVGYPKPSVTWFHRECRIPQDCYNFQFVEYDISSSTPLKIHNNSSWISTLVIPAAVETGQIACVAENAEGETNDTINFIVTDMPFDDGIWLNIGGETFNLSQQIVEKDNVTLHCGVSVANFTSEVFWYKDDKRIGNTSENTVLNTSTKYSYRSSLFLPCVSKKNNGFYRCDVQKNDNDEGIPFYFDLDVKDLQEPYFVETNAKPADWSISQGDMVSWTCRVAGRPKPKVVWYKGNEPFKIGANQSDRIVLDKDHSTLKISFARESDDGLYMCVATNTASSISQKFSLKIKDKANTTGLIVGIVIMAIVFIVAVVIFAYKFREAQKFKRELIAAGLNHFEEGAMDNFNPELPIDEQANLLPYDKKWEFPRDKLKLGRQLGAGAFGVVRKAEAWGIVEGESVTTVAVKMVKSADLAYVKALASELKIMLHLGKHLNVVNLLGACTKDLNKKEFLVIVEFCRYGNLHNYLLRHRDRYVDQIDPKTGKIDYCIGSELLSRSLSINSTKSKMKYAALSFSTHSDGNNTAGEGGSCNMQPSSPVPRSPDLDSDMTVCMTPTGDEESPMLSNNSVQPGWRSNFHGDYKHGNVRAIFTRDLLCWAFQVARGMEYLAGRKVMHGDLAARNILLAEDNIVKICDFGLAKSMYKSGNYKKKGDSPLPVKWMAIEAIRDRIFSTQSDIWSFGIVLWEFFSLARTPYPGMEADEKLYNNLLNGYRMECPQFATREIYQMMLDCWLAQPTQRPSFTELSEQLGAMLEESVRAHYIDLNDPYMAMNSQMMQNQSDYLSMMATPTYDNLMSPTCDEPEHHYVNSPAAANQLAQETCDNSGYLKMKGVPSHDAVIFSPRACTVEGNVFTFTTPPVQKRSMSNESQSNEVRPMLGGTSQAMDQKPPVNNLNKDVDQNCAPMKEMKITNDLKLPGAAEGQGQCFSNPNYVGPVKTLGDNYINLSQEKKGALLNKDKFGVPLNEAQNNSQNYLFMGKNSNLSKENVPKSFLNPSYVSNSPMEKERYLQLAN